MKTTRGLLFGCVIAFLVCACGDIYTSSGGGGEVKFSADLTGLWSGRVGGIADDFKTTASYPLEVELTQLGTTLVGSVYIPDCFPKSPITSGGITRLRGTDLVYISFTATGPGREFSLGFGELSQQGGVEMLDGLAGMQTNKSDCISFGFPLGTAQLERQ